MGGTGAFSGGASRRCCPWRYFIPAGCLGCFSFLLGGQLLCWEIWDSWMFQELGAPLTLPPWLSLSVLMEPAGAILPPPGIPGVPGRGEKELGCFGDGIWWRQTRFPLTPSGREGGKCPSPHFGELSGFQAEFPASPSCCWNLGGAACLPCPVAILVGPGLSPLLGRRGWRWRRWDLTVPP